MVKCATSGTLAGSGSGNRTCAASSALNSLSPSLSYESDSKSFSDNSDHSWSSCASAHSTRGPTVRGAGIGTTAGDGLT